MKLFFQLTILVFLTLSSCKSSQPEKTAPRTDAPKVEFTEYELGESDLPKLKSEVNDYESIFTFEQRLQLTKKIREFEKNTTNEIAIVSIDSIGKYTDFNQFAIDLSNYNGVGQKEKDNGLTIVFSKTLRKIRISTGYGTEKILTDEICKKVIDEAILPEFENGDYYIGIKKGMEELINKWQ